MRRDFTSVICERLPHQDASHARIRNQGRLVSSKRHKMNRRVRFDDDFEVVDPPFRSSVGRYGKDSGFFLEPFRGWLANSVGRSWNAIYSELARTLRKSPEHRRQILQWLEYYVVRSCFVVFEGEQPYAVGREHSPSCLEITGDQLYVDPRDGLLKWGKGRHAHRYHMLRHSPAQQREYKPLPKTGDRRLVVPAPESYANGDSLLYWNEEERRWYRKWSYARTFVKYFAVGSPYRNITETVEVDQVAHSRVLKSLGYRPPRKRRK